MATMPNLAPADSGSRISVLLVEDDSAEALRIMEMLAAARGGDVLVSHAEGVESALRMLIEGSYDVVLLDLTLPDGSGIDALLRAKVAAASVPVLVMADEDNGPQALQALRAGAQDYLVKSELDTQLVTRTLRHAVERHRMLRHLTEVQQREHFLATHDGRQQRGLLLGYLHKLVHRHHCRARFRPTSTRSHHDKPDHRPHVPVSQPNRVFPAR